MTKILSFIGRFFLRAWKILATGAALLSGLFFLTAVGMVLALIFFQPKVEIEAGSALVLAPRGKIAEKRSPFDPVSRLFNNMAGVEVTQELLLQDIINGIRTATDDDRIKLLLIVPDLLEQAGLNQLQEIGRAIDGFKESGKVVIAYGDNFNQGQYYLASWSDELFLNPMGAVNLRGFGIYRLYMRDLLDKLAVNLHVFKVGTFKSALEPFVRNNMSPQAKEANRQWLTNLWDNYCSDIALHRGIPAQAVNNAVNRLADNMRLADGDTGRMALNNGLIDGLKTRGEMRQYLNTLVGGGSSDNEFRQVDFADYLTTLHSVYDQEYPGKPKVGIIVARGDIVYGEGAVGQIGSTPLSRQIRHARKDGLIRALALRIDSGGGSAFASELIRQELLLTQKAGKPVVVSMGSMAASGGYWLAADADRIFASPATLTGSIGIFGALPTFERTLAGIGVHSDGIGTTDLAGADNLTRKLNDNLSRALQSGVERGYQRFIDIVAHGRGMEPAAVEQIAEGRVWDGATALEIGLVDELGSLEDAVATAAGLAGMPEIRAVYIQETENPAERLLKKIGAAQKSFFADSPAASFDDILKKQLTGPYAFLAPGDPQHIYSHCLLSGSMPFF